MPLKNRPTKKSAKEEVIKTLKKKSLKKKAEESTRIVKKKGKDTETLKEGLSLDHSPKHLTSSNLAGVNIGITKNMGDYESLRVDCWLTDEIMEGETQSEALQRLSEIALAEVERQVEEIGG